MKIMISQPMGGLSEEDILAQQTKAREAILDMGHETIDTYYTMDPPSTVLNRGLFYLGASLMDMAKCDAVYFCKGWENAKGCRLEHDAANLYGVTILYEE